MSEPYVQCCLCLGEVLVPVKTKAFDCQRLPGKPSCHDVNRICLLCASKFFHLNTPVRMRPNYLKCLFCPATCDPRVLNAESAYEKDFMLMSLLTRKDIPCFHSDLGCTFKGNQNEMDRHIQDECVHRITKCQCGTFHKVIDTPEHYKECRYYKQCPCCKDWKHVDVMVKHVELDHYSKFCAHCHKVYFIHTIAEHVLTCTMRLVNCDFCNNHVMYSKMGEHLMFHITTASQKMKNCMEQLKNATEALEMFQSGGQL